MFNVEYTQSHSVVRMMIVHVYVLKFIYDLHHIHVFKDFYIHHIKYYYLLYPNSPFRNDDIRTNPTVPPTMICLTFVSRKRHLSPSSAAF